MISLIAETALIAVFGCIVLLQDVKKGRHGGTFMFTLIVTGALFWICSLAFPIHIMIEGFGALVLSTILFFVADYLIGLLLCGLIFRVMKPSLFTEEVSGAQVLTIIVLFVALLLTGMFSILLLSKCLPGFWVDGKLTAFLLSLIPAVTTTKARAKRRGR